MSKIKLRDKDIKIRSIETVTTKVFRRINIKALAKNAKPTVQEEQSTEADAVDAGTEATAAAMQKVSVVRKRASQAQKQHQTHRNAAPETPEPPPAFSSTSQKDHPDIHIKQEMEPVEEVKTEAPIKTAHTTVSMHHTTTHTSSDADTPPIVDTKTLSADKLQIKSATTIQPKQANTTIKHSNSAKTTPIQQSAQRIHQSKAAAAQAAAAKKLSKTEKITEVLKSVIQKVGKTIESKLPILCGGCAGVLSPVLIVILIGALLASPSSPVNLKAT